MTKQLLPQVEKYFRTNLHTHTNISDGAPTPEEMKQFYKARGYQVLSLTDHNLLVDHSALNDEDFLMLTGVEYNINQPGWGENRLRCKTYHLNFIAKDPTNLWMPFGPSAVRDSNKPYYEKCTVADPRLVDGYEVRNRNNQNDLTQEFADRHPQLIRLRGSDFHREEHTGWGGILTDTLPENDTELAALLRSGNYQLL